jgi:hypothetical protein
VGGCRKRGSGCRRGDDGVGVGRGEAGAEEGMMVWVSEEGKRVQKRG